MKKFDENNNPIFSKSENLLINFLSIIGFGILCAGISITLCFVYFYPIFLELKNIVVKYPILIILILFFILYLYMKLCIKLDKWVQS